MRETQRLRFTGGRGDELVGILERPTAEPRFTALLAHCFTCTKDLKSIVRLSRDLVGRGIAVFRFDFTGLGESAGDFSRSTFRDNVADLHAAINFLNRSDAAPRLLIGHSLGGAAALAAAAGRNLNDDANRIAAVCALASPSETPHLAAILERLDPTLRTAERGEVTIGGQTLAIDREMLDGLRSYDLPATLAGFDLPTLLFHSIVDETVGFANAQRLHLMLAPNCSLMVLPDADHLFVRDPRDIAFLGATISTWSERLGVG